MPSPGAHPCTPAACGVLGGRSTLQTLKGLSTREREVSPPFSSPLAGSTFATSPAPLAASPARTKERIPLSGHNKTRTNRRLTSYLLQHLRQPIYQNHMVRCFLSNGDCGPLLPFMDHTADGGSQPEGDMPEGDISGRTFGCTRRFQPQLNSAKSPF